MKNPTPPNLEKITSDLLYTSVGTTTVSDLHKNAKELYEKKRHQYELDWQQWKADMIDRIALAKKKCKEYQIDESTLGLNQSMFAIPIDAVEKILKMHERLRKQ
jgi:hypothetical protein